ncbi:major capsid protein [Desulfocurvibacter africanus]|uniref:major capsid protein n=1 Tax=Desulfocurvibacter africanus TaxID=873 RepID=UPI000405220C|nr:hypothetical protein [Desulfocurvibacter africanus]
MLTLTEASKLIQNPLQRGIIEIFPRTSPVLERLPFLTVNGNAYSYNLEKTLPGIAFRDYNQTYDESTGVVNPYTESLKIFGGISKVDRAQVKTQGNVNDLRAIHDAMKAKAAALEWTKAFFKGDTDANTLSFDGLEKRLTGSQVIDAGASTGGDALTLAKLDELIDSVQAGPGVLFMNKAMRRKVNTLMRAAGQATEVVSDSFGRMIPTYAGIPIGVIEVDKDGNEILSFTEADSAGSAAACTSIYAVRFGVMEWVSGLQASPMEVIDQGLKDVFYQTLIEWISSIAIFHPKAAARLQGIKNA